MRTIHAHASTKLVCTATHHLSAVIISPRKRQQLAHTHTHAVGRSLRDEACARSAGFHVSGS